jgi:hypothetical protein
MNKQQNTDAVPVVVDSRPERKKTVTLVLGPETLALLDRLDANLNRSGPCGGRSVTDLVGVILNSGLASWRTRYLKESECLTWSHFD